MGLCLDSVATVDPSQQDLDVDSTQRGRDLMYTYYVINNEKTPAMVPPSIVSGSNSHMDGQGKAAFKQFALLA